MCISTTPSEPKPVASAIWGAKLSKPQRITASGEWPSRLSLTVLRASGVHSAALRSAMCRFINECSELRKYDLGFKPTDGCAQRNDFTDYDRAGRFQVDGLGRDAGQRAGDNLLPG